MPTETHAGAVLLRPLVDRLAATTMGLVEARDGGVWLDDRAASEIGELIEFGPEQPSILDAIEDAAEDARTAASELESAARDIRREVLKAASKASAA